MIPRARAASAVLWAWAFAGVLSALLAGRAAAQMELSPGARVMLVGGTFAERWAQSGWFEAALHATHPAHDLVVRSVPWSADEAGLMPRELNVPTTLDRVRQFDPDVVFVCFGMAESFAGDADRFAEDLAALCDALAARDSTPRTLVLISPIRHEPIGNGMPRAEQVEQHNAALAEHARVVQRVASERGHAHVDLFKLAQPGLTINGIHPSPRGCMAAAVETASQLGWLSAPAIDNTDGAALDPAATADTIPDNDAWPALLAACSDKFWYERLIYRPTNTEYVWGRRHEPFGNVNFPEEFAQLERMVSARQSRIHALPAGALAAISEESAAALAAFDPWPALPLALGLPEDRWTPTPVEAKGTETSLGSVTIASPDEFLSTFTVAPGYVIECFASERDFPELANPLALTFDHRHRLWVLVAPTYPHLLPGEAPRCTLLIMEDRDGDGRADTRTVFADGLYIPTGFAIDTDAVYVGQAPDLLRLRDVDGDDRADTREIVASGFSMPDSHHQLSAFEWDPMGGILLHEGVFGVASIETPWGVRRSRDAAVWRFEPRTRRLDVLSHCGFANPWGHAFDDFGQSLLADASGGEGFSFSHVIHAFEYPRKPGRPGAIHNRGRPTAGAELLASRHFPDDAQGTLLINQSIGFHGTRWDRLVPEGSSWRAERMPTDLVESSDPNFRPVAIEVGPDGALYIVDWCNPLIGHMQYSLRDPRRDHGHGRIWRVRHESRPLLIPPAIDGASADQLVNLLRLPERNTRQIARRRLQTMPTAEARTAFDRALALLDANDPLHDRLWLESLWWSAAVGLIELDRADRVAQLRDARARAGAVRVLRHWAEAGLARHADLATMLDRAAGDSDMRVRLEAVIAAGFLPRDSGLGVVERAAGLPMDPAMAVVARETVVHLARDDAPPGDDATEHPLVRRIRLEAMSAEALSAEPMDQVVAGVMVTRADVPIEARIRAAQRLWGDALIAELLDRVAADERATARAALSQLALAIPTDAAAHDRGAVERAALAHAPATGAPGAHDAAVLATAMLVRSSTDRPTDQLDPSSLADALSLLEPGDVPAPVLDALRESIGGVASPMRAMDQLARHTPADHRPALTDWLTGHAQRGAVIPLAEWSAEHERAMAAASALATLGAIAPTDRAPPERLARGHQIYLDEAIGCARCHGTDGRGLEGFPPLDRSPIVLGPPARAAAIVAHGLFGPITLPDGSTINSAMAPLGGLLDDAAIADVLTFVRQSWGNFAPAVSAEDAAAARAQAPPNGVMWESRALLARYPLERDGVFGALTPANPTAPSPIAAATGSASVPTTESTTQLAPTAARARAGIGGQGGVVALFGASAVALIALIGAAAAISRATAKRP